MRNANFFESGFDWIADQVSADANADLTGDWIDISGYDRAYYILQKPAGSAGDDLAIDLNQATNNTGGSTKALTFSKLWDKVGTLNAVTQWTARVLDTPVSDLDLDALTIDGATVDLATDTNAAQIKVEIIATSLDTNGGFTHIQVLLEGDDISNALIVSTGYFMVHSKYPQAIPLSAIG